MKKIEDLRVLIDRIPYAEGNVGEEAILASLLQDLEECGIKDISVLSNQPERTKTRHGDKIAVVSDKAGHWLKLPSDIRKYDLLIWGGGHMLQDRSSQLYIPYVTKTLLAAKLFGVPRFIYAPGLGPVVNRFGKLLSRQALNGSGCVLVRDAGSAKFLDSIGVRGEIHLTADPGFSLKTEYDGLQVDRHESAPVIGVAPRRLFYRKGSFLPVSWQLSSQRLENAQFDSYLEDTASTLDLLVEKHNAEIRLFALDIGPNPRDDLICSRIKQMMSHPQKVKIYDDDASLGTFVYRLSELDLLVSARLHGIILGLRFGLPFIGIDSDGKIPQLCDTIGMSEYVIKDTDFSRDRFYDTACKALKSTSELRKSLIERNAELKLKAQENCKFLKLYLNSFCEAGMT